MDTSTQKAAIYGPCDTCGKIFRLRRWRVHIGATVLNPQLGMDYIAWCGCGRNRGAFGKKDKRA